MGHTTPLFLHLAVWKQEMQSYNKMQKQRCCVSFNADYTTQLGKDVLDRQKEINKAKSNLGVMKSAFGENMIGEEK